MNQTVAVTFGCIDVALHGGTVEQRGPVRLELCEISNPSTAEQCSKEISGQETASEGKTDAILCL